MWVCRMEQTQPWPSDLKKLEPQYNVHKLKAEFWIYILIADLGSNGIDF